MSSSESSAMNALERQRWNDEYWTGTWPVREQLTSCATEPLVAIASPGPGDRVLDVGCGCGTTTMLAAAAVGEHGHVLGADISEVLLGQAQDAAASNGVANASFVLADVQAAALPDGPFDVVMSKFGVMFFELPGDAFENLSRHSAPGARLAFACWQPASENPWFLGHALGPLLPKAAPPAPGAHVTGPFAFCDPTDVTAILEGAGWSDVSVDAHDGTVVVDREAIAEHGQPAFMGVAEANLAEATEAIDRHASKFERPDGRLEVPVAFFVVSARASR
jgi:SAM-dependent methyltransferase